MILPLKARTRLCKDCGRSVLWAKLPSGKWIALDPVARTFVVAFGTDATAVALPATSTLVSHYATCPKVKCRSTRGSLEEGRSHKPAREGSTPSPATSETGESAAHG